ARAARRVEGGAGGADLDDARPRVRLARPLHGGPLSRLRLSLPASAGARRAPGRVLPGPLSAPPGAVAAGAGQALARPPPGRQARARERARVPGVPGRARLRSDEAPGA